MDFVHRRILIFVLAVTRHPRVTLALVGVSLIGCIALAGTSLSLSSDQNELFSHKIGFFQDYLDFIKKFPENEALYIVIEPRDSTAPGQMQAWMDLADRITDRLSGLKEYVVEAQCKIPIEEMGKNGILFERPDLLASDRDGAAQLAGFWGQKPGAAMAFAGRTPMERFLTLVAAQPDDRTAAFVTRMCESWNKALDGQAAIDLPRLMADNPSRLGYFYVPDESDRSHYRILVRVYPHANRKSLTGITETVDAIRNAANDVAKDYPQFTIGVTGRPALEADEMGTTDVDSHRAEAIALVTIFIGMVIMLRSFWLALAAELALGVGIGWTFGWATVSVHQLNLLSMVFLIALIGIGMDYLVQILSRYRREARLYQRPDAVWVRVFRHVGPPINTACLGAAGAFLVAVFTVFQGAAELGIIAGGGLLLVLLSGYVVLPALLTIFPPRLKPMQAWARYVGAPRRAKGLLLFPAIWLTSLAVFAPYMAKPYFNPGLIELQVPTLTSVKLIHTLQTWAAVVLSDNLDQLRTVSDKMAVLPEVSYTESILDAKDNADWLAAHAGEVPTIDWSDPEPITAADLPNLASKARNLAGQFHSPTGDLAAEALKRFAGRLGSETDAQRLSQWQEKFVKNLRDLMDSFHPSPVDLPTLANSLPGALRGHLTDGNGYYALYIYPKKDLWIRANLDEFMRDVEKTEGAIPGAPRVTGIASNVYYTTDAIRGAFFQSTWYALILIFVLVLLDFRNLRLTLAAVSVLAFGLPMLLAIMGAAGVNWNFANFFGLPILIGAGHEYGVFMVHRYVEAKKFPRRVWTGWDVSDRALFLCAFITTSSFGYFWLLARHQGLKSLGLVMALGTGCIYLSTVMVLRPILRWRLANLARESG
jgi:predicted RND superfamily exporter protein